MSFPSLEFAIFAVLFFALWPWVRPHQGARWTFLSTMSLVFYAWWDWRYLPLLLLNGLIDFGAALAIVRWPARRRFWLTVSLAANCGILGLFKYAGFVMQNLGIAMGWAGITPPPEPWQLTLPLGISFYTFQSMSYTIDVYRGTLRPATNVLHFFSYLALFPQLVAGPIVRGSELLPQLRGFRVPDEAERWQGTTRIVRGFFKKMVLADTFAPVVAAAFDGSVAEHPAAFWWIIAAMFAAQIYCDFSGYSDIACGLAQWMGYGFPENFREPFRAVGFRDFWERWHVSLSTWFRDYVYIPLGGSRQGPFRGHLNLWATLLLSGLWHGAAWHFVLWGAFHAALLSVERATRWPQQCSKLPGGRLVAWGLTTALVLFSWVLFRAPSTAQAAGIFCAMLDLGSLASGDAVSPFRLQPLVLLGGFYLGQWVDFTRIPLRLPEWPVLDRWIQPAGVGCLAAVTIFLRGPGNAFIYFQF